jgi:hypothetical protein
MNDGPQFDYDRESQSAGLAGMHGSTRVFCDPPLALSRYRSEDRKDAGNTLGSTGMWPRSIGGNKPHSEKRGGLNGSLQHLLTASVNEAHETYFVHER